MDVLCIDNTNKPLESTFFFLSFLALVLRDLGLRSLLCLHCTILLDKTTLDPWN